MIKAALSFRIAERPRDKSTLLTPLVSLLDLAARHGFQGICSRASAISIDSSIDARLQFRRALTARGLSVSMVTGNTALATNDVEAPDTLKNIRPHLELAKRFDAPLVRVMLHHERDIANAQRAADEAKEHDVSLAQPLHWGSLAETVDQALALVRRVDRSNFGLTFEPANLLAAGDSDYAAAIHRLAPYLLNVYFQNIYLDKSSEIQFPTRTHGPIGVQFVPLNHPLGINVSPIIEALYAIDYQGWFTIHQPALDGQRVAEAVADAGQFVRATL
ncbi:MAG: sugar phosphate isomerase/epimerase [Pseudomonadota bacterium]